MNERVRAFLIFPPVLALAGALVAAPQIVHVMDRGSTLATVEEIASGKLTSRQVTVTAFVFPDRGLRQIVTKQKSQTSPVVSFFMPIDDQFDSSRPSVVVVEAFRNEVTDAAQDPGQPLTLQGTVRDVLWEGLDSDVKRDLALVHPLSPSVKLLQLRGGGNALSDPMWAYGFPLLGLIIGLLAASNVKSPPQEPQVPA